MAGVGTAHLMLGQLGQRTAHVLLQPVQGHGWLVGQDVDTLSELVCYWVQDRQSAKWDGRVGWTGGQGDKASDPWLLNP